MQELLERPEARPFFSVCREARLATRDGAKARRRDGATFRRREAPRAAHRPHEQAQEHYLVAEMCDGKDDVPHPGAPLPFVSSLYLANYRITFGQVSLFGLCELAARRRPGACRT